MPKLTLKKINNAIKDKFPGIYVEKVDNYFIVDSDDKELSLKISALSQQSIYVFRVNDLSLEQWISSIEYVLNDSYRNPLEREPVFEK